MITPEELIQLREKVEKEMKRRCYYGSLTSFSDDAWKFDIPPASGEEVLEEHGKKVIEPILQIKDYGDLNIEDMKKGGVIPESFDSPLLDEIDELSKESITGDKTSCRGACTGLCIGTCGSGCSGCTATCGGTCESNCTKTCGTSCGSCSSTCTGGCHSSCNTTCKSGCTGCKSSCTTTCGSNCYGSNTYS